MTFTSMICAAAASVISLRSAHSLSRWTIMPWWLGERVHPRLGPAVARPVGLPPRLRVADVVAGCDQASARVGAGLHELLPPHLTQGHRLPRLDRGNLALDSVHDLPCLVPAPLKLAGHQAISGIDSIVLSAGMRGLIACLLKRQLQLSLRGRCLVRLSIDRLHRLGATLL